MTDRKIGAGQPGGSAYTDPEHMIPPPEPQHRTHDEIVGPVIDQAATELEETDRLKEEREKRNQEAIDQKNIIEVGKSETKPLKGYTNLRGVAIAKKPKV